MKIYLKFILFLLWRSFELNIIEFDWIVNINDLIINCAKLFPNVTCFIEWYNIRAMTNPFIFRINFFSFIRNSLSKIKYKIKETI